MTVFTRIAAAGALAILAPLSADALPIDFSIVASSPQGAGNQAHVFAPNYGAFLPAGASWTAAPNIVTPPPGNNSGNFQSPWNNTPLLERNSYFSVQTNVANNPALLSFVTPRSSFTFLWGSIDSYNEVRLGLFDGTDTTFSSELTGTTVADEIGGACGDPNNHECVALVTLFAGDGQDAFGQFNVIEFSSVGANAFEIAAIPLPAAAWLLLAASGGLIAAKRRHARRAA